MKKYYINIGIALMLSSSIAMAEESGAFVGFGMGYGSMENKFTATMQGGIVNTKSENATNIQIARFEIMSGYKYFFTDNLGLRAYGIMAYDNQLKVKDNLLDTLDLSLNLDALYNFKKIDKVELGVFAGAGVGFNYWGEVKDLGVGQNLQPHLTTPDIILNLGTRATIDKHNAIELLVRVPFLTRPIWRYESTIMNQPMVVEYTRGVKYNLNLRYVHHF